MTDIPVIELVIFDCDGVLIDSEEPSCRLIAGKAREAGLQITDEEAMCFAGKSLTDVKREIEQATGSDLDPSWVADRQADLVQLMQEEATLIDGASHMLEAVERLGLPFRVGSNSSFAEMEAKFNRVGYTSRLAGRIHSARDMGAPKPAPDVYLQAAREENINPRHCIVLEDTDTGAMAARNAGMRCVLLRTSEKPAPRWDGLYHIEHLRDFVPLLERIGVSGRRG